MSIIINHGKDSQSIRRILRRSGLELSSAIERLSSGLRINSAADDPGGLSVVTRLGARLRSVNQAIRNVNSGISVVQTAESALGESSSMLERIREIAVQAANSTATATDRAALQAEVDSLVDELNRIGDATEFNTHNLLDGSFRDREVTVGIDAGQTVSITIADSRATRLGARAEVVGAGVGNLALNTDAVFINGADVGPAAGADDTLSTTLVSSSALAKAAAINRVGAVTGVQAKVEPTVVEASDAVEAFDLEAGDLLINSTDVGVVNNIQDEDSGGVFTAAINAIAVSTGVTATLDADTGLITLTAADGRNVDLAVVNEDTEFDTQVASAPLRLTSHEPFSIGGSSSSILGVTAGLFSVDFADVVNAIEVTTAAAASSALATLDAAIDQVSLRRGDLGAVHNRLESAVSGLQSQSENLSVAHSRIADSDFAFETARLARATIMEQAAVSLLAQANSRPEIVLELLS